FSSRRRHTRFSRDWSSDVCSSDLRPARPCREVGEGGQGEKRTQNKNIHRTTSKIRRCVERRFSEARCKAGLHCGVHRTARPDRKIGRASSSERGSDGGLAVTFNND